MTAEMLNSRKAVKMRASLEKRAMILGIPRSTWKPIIDLFINDCILAGEEWTIGRFKSLVADFTQWLATGNRSPVPWVKKTLNPKFHYGGSIGILERWANKSTDRKIRALQLLKCYTCLKSNRVTETQLSKFLTAVQSEASNFTFGFPTSRLMTQDPIYRKFGESMVSQFSKTKTPCLFASVASPSKRGPTPHRSVPEREAMVDSIRFLSDFSDGFYLYAKYEKIFQEVVGETLVPHITRHYGVGLREDGFHVGRIGLIQEAGYKLRAVANPGRVFQFATHKLGSALYSALRTLPWDCTFEQDRAFSHIKSRLSNNRPVFCVDLRNATDYFPLQLQKQLLVNLLPGEQSEMFQHIRLWEDLSKSPWKLKDSMVSWKRGQPLGLFPSFAAFAATHGFLLYELNGRRFNGEFYVLGDDVVILCNKLYDKYVSALVELGCPTSPEKTLVSPKVAEFAGKLVFPDKIVPLLKWRGMSDESFMDIAALLGQRALSILEPRQRRVAERFFSFPTLGKGWNPKGLPLDDRLSEEKRFIALADDDMPELRMDRYREAWADIFSSKTFRYARESFGEPGNRFFENISPSTDLDQRSEAIVRDTLGEQFTALHRMFLSTAVWVSQKGYPVAAHGVHNGRQTTLQVLERKFKQLDQVD